jgi:Protein of unknown function (DUF3662)/FHA domain
MNVLRSVENAISGLLEGAFGRAFRSEVRPVELARKLAREMDAHREASVSRTYAPNEFEVYLSAQDRARYEGIEDEVVGELCAYLLEHARQEELVLATPPRISFHTDEELSLGEFGISSKLTRDPVPAGEDAPAPGARSAAARPAAGRGANRAGVQGSGPPPASAAGGSGETMVWSSAARLREPLEEGRPRRTRAALVDESGRRTELPVDGATIGRSRGCDVVVDDAGVSRRHAEIRPGPDGWRLNDLGSTNGVSVDGVMLEVAHLLADGERIELGSTVLRFEER